MSSSDLVSQEHQEAILKGAQDLCWQLHKKQSVCRTCLRDIAYVFGQEIMGNTIDSQEEQITELKVKIKRLIETHDCAKSRNIACQLCLEAARG